MNKPHVLPDCRLKDQTKGSVLYDWPLGNGRFVRLEVIPVFCGNCGAEGPYVPKDNTSFAFWLCQNCFETHGIIAGTYAQPDDEFNRAVSEEMQARFGHDLTAEEIAVAVEQGQLGTALELLMRESPYKTFRGE